jgi:hypothetical protein
MGPNITRIEYGRVDGGAGMKEDPVMRRASEMVRVRQALEAAYPEDAHPVLTAAECVGVLLARTPGVLADVRPYDELSTELGVSVGSLQALVKRGRAAVVVELAARGLIPMPKPALGLDEAIEAKRERLVANG